MIFLARLVSDNSKSLKKFELGALSSPATPKEKFLHRIRVHVHGYLRLIFNLPSSINLKRYKRFPQIGGSEPLLEAIREGPTSKLSCTIGFYEYDFPLVINCTQSRILQRSPDNL